MKRHALILAISTALLAVINPLNAQAAVYDATADFSVINNNPNGVWSYGWDPADAAGAYTFTAFDQVSGSGWQTSSHNILGTPGIWKNISGSTAYGVAPGQLSLHPAEDQFSLANDNAAILRFTASISGTYNVSAQFFAGDSGDTLAWVVKNNAFSSALASLGSTGSNPTYATNNLLLQAGDTLDFVVGNSSDNLWSDNTPVSVTISAAVPEPETYALMLAGLGLVSFAARRRRV